MPSYPRRVALVIALSLAGSTFAAEPAPRGVLEPQQREAFLAEVQEKYGIAPETVAPMLDKARYQQRIIDAITRPAEAKPWKDYRPIFLGAERITKGRAFLEAHRDALTQVEAGTGVPAAIIVAILGVETSYGGNTGSWKVLDALYTLGFFHEPRATFFRGELAQVFALAQEESLDLTTITGSYAGAMGWGQFIPSSYRAYSIDGDGDGKRDLWNSLPDVFASVANYFKAHKWQRGEPVAVRAVRAEGAEDFKPGSLEARYTLLELADKGYRPAEAIGHAAPATLLTLEGAEGTEYWITFNNFYVISRYNRSPLYSMAVFHLAQAIAGTDSATLEP
ncbi:lytic murein transglycosylase B [Xanthomonadaceae bacterium JHOS43]|nr:lytic murein transglycosylase B [Xanthomonadaceae bacterium JHOS43]MCX7564510.1 lytic murein transglycosylase B [Xanthomonadaceae bacterium XH05]